MSTIVVFVEHSEGSAKRAGLEVLGAACSAAQDVVAVLCGTGARDAAAELGSAGASKAVCLDGSSFSPDAAAEGIAAIVREQGAAAFLASATSTGRDVAPRVAAHLGSTLFTDCTDLRADGDAFTIQMEASLPSSAGTIRSRQT